MGRPSLCIGCKRHQVPSLGKLGEFSHSGYCPACAKDLALRSLGALAYYGLVDPHFLELLDSPLAVEGYAGRRRRLEAVRYRHGVDAGMLVAINRAYEPDAMGQHQAVLRKRKLVVFGKFRYSRDVVGGTHVDLENWHRERYDGALLGPVRERVATQLAEGRPLFLFVLDPDPPAALWRGRIRSAHMESDARTDADIRFGLPPFGVEDLAALVPSYYWLDGDRTQLRYHCNYWFLLGSLEQIDLDALAHMQDLETERSITLATPQLYPAEVSVRADLVEVIDECPDTSDDAEGRLRRRVLRVPTVLRSLRRVRLSRHALRGLASCSPSTLAQSVDLLIQMERAGRHLDRIAVRCNDVAGGDGLKEFRVTSGGRVAAGWLAQAWQVLAIEGTHREGPTSWNRIIGMWRRIRL